MDGKIKTVFDAAREIKNKRISLSEKALSYISELAEILIDEADEDEIFFRDESFISRYRSLTELPNESNVAPFNENEVNALERQLNVTEKALLCLMLSDVLGIVGIEGSGTFFDDPPRASGETVACVKSRLSDDAYISFTADMAEPRVSYVHDLNEVCESVLYGKTAYGILPTSGAKPMLQKHGLKISRRLKINNGNGNDAAFVLIKKDLDIPESAENAYFEFAVKTDDPSKILLASEACSMKPIGIAYTAESKTLSLTLSISESGFCGFLTYLSLNYPDFVPYGIYKEL